MIPDSENHAGQRGQDALDSVLARFAGCRVTVDVVEDRGNDGDFAVAVVRGWLIDSEVRNRTDGSSSWQVWITTLAPDARDKSAWITGRGMPIVTHDDFRPGWSIVEEHDRTIRHVISPACLSSPSAGRTARAEAGRVRVMLQLPQLHDTDAGYWILDELLASAERLGVDAIPLESRAPHGGRAQLELSISEGPIPRESFGVAIATSAKAIARLGSRSERDVYVGLMRLVALSPQEGLTAFRINSAGSLTAVPRQTRRAKAPPRQDDASRGGGLGRQLGREPSVEGEGADRSSEWAFDDLEMDDPWDEAQQVQLELLQQGMSRDAPWYDQDDPEVTRQHFRDAWLNDDR